MSSGYTLRKGEATAMRLDPTAIYDIVDHRPSDHSSMAVHDTVRLRIVNRSTGARILVDVKLTELDRQTGDFEGVTIPKDHRTPSQRLGGSFVHNGCPDLHIMRPGSGD